MKKSQLKKKVSDNRNCVCEILESIKKQILISNQDIKQLQQEVKQLQQEVNEQQQKVKQQQQKIEELQKEVNQLQQEPKTLYAACYIEGLGGVPNIKRSINTLPGGLPVTVNRIMNGNYEVNFGVDITDRYCFATPSAGDTSISVYTNINNVKNVLRVICKTLDNIPIDANFFLLVI